jgi:hypothetical protein
MMIACDFIVHQYLTLGFMVDVETACWVKEIKQTKNNKYSL